MLGKNARGLFWMYRFLERAENTARLIETGQRIALTRAEASDDEWLSVLQTAGVDQGYAQKHEEIAKDSAIDWMLRDTDNPSSVLSTVKQARDNARLVRTALTPDVWEAVNGTWMQLREVLARKIGERDLPRTLGLVRERSALVRGATRGTMLRNDIYDFLRLGTFIERADNTGRILDVKYYVLLPSSVAVGSSLDNVQWETILRSVSARGGFRMVYGDQARPPEIVQFLVLDNRMPRSLRFCCSKIRSNLEFLAHDYGAESTSLDMARSLADEIDGKDVAMIFDAGLHQFIQETLSKLAALSRQIELDYRFYE